MAERATNIIDEMEFSKTQERYAKGQVCKVFQNGNILPSNATMTKRQAMDANRAAGAKQSHEVHDKTPVGWNTYHSYASACLPLGIFARQEGIRDLYQLTPQVVGDYLKMCVDFEIKFSTYDKNCSSIEKLCECINDYNVKNGGEKLDFHGVISEIRDFARAELPPSDFSTRAYDDPRAIIDHLPEGNMQIAAGLQLYCGLRISDACVVKLENWDGKHLTVINSKNGQTITVTPPPEQAAKITAALDKGGLISVNRNQYDYHLEKACTATGQEWHGSHGLRHNFAQERMAEYIGQGMTFNEALQAVSEDMGHHRLDITKHYLR